MKTLFSAIIISLLFTGISASQDRTNLEVFYELIDSSITMLPDLEGNINVALYTGNSILLYDYVYFKLNKRYGSVEVTDKDYSVSYILEKINLDYQDVFRKKFLGDYYVIRNFLIEGAVSASEKSFRDNFRLTVTDTVKLDNIHLLENELHPFTKAAMPSEHFSDSIVEPVVAIGTAAAAVVLFFIIRSK
jgi:hypothetical protein